MSLPPAPYSIAGKRLVLVTVVVLRGTGLLGWWPTTTPADLGPLKLPGINSSESGGPVLPGQWMVTSIVTASLARSTPAIVESVRPTEPSQASGLILRYAVLTDTPRGLPGAIRGWPPLRYHLADLQGHLVQPGNELRLAVGAHRITSAGGGSTPSTSPTRWAATCTPQRSGRYRTSHHREVPVLSLGPSARRQNRSVTSIGQFACAAA